MASIRQHGNRWQARVTRNGYPEASSSFDSKHAAERRARSVEAEMDRGVYQVVNDDHKVTLGELIHRYIREVLPQIRGFVEDSYRLTAITKRRIAGYSLTNLSPEHITQYRDQRLREVSPGTVVRELAYISSIINHARKEWRFPISNPVALARKPSTGRGRDRVLSLDEQARLLQALEPTGRKNPLMIPLVQLALETAMRRGELMVIQWRDVDLIGRTIVLHTSKNGEGRVVPLSSKAVAVLETCHHAQGLFSPSLPMR